MVVALQLAGAGTGSVIAGPPPAGSICTVFRRTFPIVSLLTKTSPAPSTAIPCELVMGPKFEGLKVVGPAGVKLTCAPVPMPEI